jgi:hypothetical protein
VFIWLFSLVTLVSLGLMTLFWFGTDVDSVSRRELAELRDPGNMSLPRVTSFRPSRINLNSYMHGNISGGDLDLNGESEDEDSTDTESDNDPYAKLLRDNRTALIRDGVYKPMADAAPLLLRLAAAQAKKKGGGYSYTIVTLGASNYKEVVLNWINHLEQLSIKKYIVLCVDQEIYKEVGPEHAILVEFNVNVTLKKYVRKRSSRTITSAESYVNLLYNSNNHYEGDKLFTSSAFKGGVSYVEKEKPAGTTQQRFAAFKKGVERPPPEPGPFFGRMFSFIKRRLTGLPAKVNDAVASSTSRISGPGKTNIVSRGPPKYNRSKYSASNYWQARPNVTRITRNVTRITRNATAYSRYRNRTMTARTNSLNRTRTSIFRSNYTSYHRAPSPKYIYDKQKAFTIMMYIKHSSILALLNAGHSVVWSDVDCIWIKSCAVSFISSFAAPAVGSPALHRHLAVSQTERRLGTTNTTESDIRIREELDKLTRVHVDIATQQGASPFATSDIIGTAICTGFFVVNPTPAGLMLISAVQQAMIATVDGSCGKNCSVGDQSAMNEILTEHGNLKEWAVHNSKILYGPSHVTYNALEETHFLATNLTVPRHLTQDTTQLQQLHDSGHIPIVVGFLPYDLFPRGDSRVNVTQMELQVAQARLRSNRTGYSRRYPIIKKNKLMSTGQAKIKNANEWADLKETACIWHMYSKKDGKTKVMAMVRDGVYLRDKIDAGDD